MKIHGKSSTIVAALLTLPVLLTVKAGQNTSSTEEAALANGVRWHLSSDKSQYLPGEKMAVEVVLSNVGTSLLIVGVGGPISDGEIRVATASYEVRLTQYGRKLGKQGGPPVGVAGAPDPSGSRHPLAPGESLTNRYYLNRLFDMTMTNHYSVTASRKVWPNPGATNFFTLKSDPLVVSVVDDQ
jgi:hypothetical protein